MRRTVLFLKTALVILTAAAVLSGCGQEKAPDLEEDKKIQIGMIFDNFVMDRWQRDRDVFVSTAKELGAEVNVQNANSSVEEQAALLQYFIKKKVDIIVLVPIDSKPLLDEIKKAQEEGIKVISYDRLVVGAQPDLYISFDNRQVGSLMAEAIASKLGRSDKVLMVCGPLTDNNVKEVQAGFLERMEEKKIEVLDTYYAAEWRPENAAAYIRQNSDMVSQVKGIMCGNDNLAGQAISALAEQRLAGEIYVTGQDADLAACQRIVEGTQYMTVYKPVEKLAARAAEAAVAMASGEALETDIYVTEEGLQVPYIKLDTIAVTALNIRDIIINSGFHLKEDVYLNRPDLLQ